MTALPSPWTPDLDARLTKRWSDVDGPSTAQIGRAHRLGLPKRASPLRRRFTPRPRPVHAAAAAVAPRFGVAVTGTDCKFIAGDPHGMFARGENPFCGPPTLSGSPYCAAHHVVCYVRATPARLAEIDRVASDAAGEDRAA